ncbi:MAG: acyl-CoA dehydrogenase family protein, partial [bacterium]|nr:acyl-CoA dehydrogenase family protein [bacterium]
MKLRYDDDVERFRAQFQEWLDENQPTPEEMESAPVRSSAHRPPWAQRGARRMFDDGWLGPGWPPELGGRKAEAVETLVSLEELY